MSADRIVCVHWPRVTRCPECASAEWEKAGSKRGRTPRLNMQYRRCQVCGFLYKSYPIAVQIDRGGDQSDVEIL